VAIENVSITRKISKETAKEWGLPEVHKMNPTPVCAVCRQGADWVDCPTGSWWAHWVHPEDNHDADLPYPESNGQATFIEAQYQHSGRWTETWLVVFVAPDDGQYWMTYYEEPSHENGEGMDPWEDSSEVVLIMAHRREVVTHQWHPVLRKVDAEA
jgi:hypothetical protein